MTNDLISLIKFVKLMAYNKCILIYQAHRLWYAIVTLNYSAPIIDVLPKANALL